MADLTYENAIAAMRKAYDSGDVESAKRMAKLAKSLEGQSGSSQEGFLGQVNRGIADVFDAINPGNAGRAVMNLVMGTDLPTDISAKNAFRDFGIATAENDPEGLVAATGRGVGIAAGSLPLVATGAGALRGAPYVGPAADAIYKGVTSVPGAMTEVVAGGLSEFGAEAVEQSGGGPVAQDVARVLTPLSIPAATSLAGKAVGVAENFPVANAVIQTGRNAVRALAPMSGPGARAVAREELVRRAGSEERAAELGGRIDPKDEFGRTPAQQTGDPEFMALEQSVKDQYPVLRERLDEQAAASRSGIRDAARGEGRIEDARAFFDARLKEFGASLQARVDRAIKPIPEATMSEEAASSRVVSNIKAELEDALSEEASKWAAVPKDVVVPTTQVKAVAKSIVDNTPRAQVNDIPRVVRSLLIDESGFKDAETVAEMHGLYSELRRVARSAMAGNDKNKNTARIANELAEAILEDLDVTGSTEGVGAAIAEARAFSRALHETFDQGAVGRILKRTLDGDETIPPEAALKRTVGPGGVDAAASVDSIVGAAPGARQDVGDYLTGRFTDALMAADGKATPRRAAEWLRQNAAVLNRFPELRREFTTALSNQRNAEQFAARAKLAQKAANEGPVARFNNGQPEAAVRSILQAANPAQAAKSIVATARKDPSGKALAGVKASFTDRLISETTGPDGVLSGAGLQNLLREKNMMAAMRQVFSPQEMQRLERIAKAAASMDVKPSGTSEIINAPVNALLMRVVQIAAAQQGGKMGASSSMGGSLQTANIMQKTATNLLRNLTNDRARRLLIDAVQDPELMRALLLEPKGGEIPKAALSKIAPYLAGGAANVAFED